MSVAFDCQSCGAHFEVDARLAGRAGRCRACGVKMTIPKVPAREPVAVAAGAPGNWLDAVTDQVALKPLTIEKFPALKRARSRSVQVWCYLAALCVFAFMVSVARSHNPLGLFAALLS